MSGTALDALHDLSGTELITAASEYIANGEQKIKEARQLRDAAISKLVDEVGLSKAARLVGMSLSGVRMIRGRS